MRKILPLIALFTFLSCKMKTQPEVLTASENDPASGKELFERKGNCIACHQPEQKIIGPGLKEIAITYKLQKGGIVTFLRGKAEPIVDPSQFEVMKTNLTVTKKMSDAELNELETYIYGFGK